MRRYAAEFFGTFVLVFAGTGAIVTDEVSGGKVTHVGVALTFGLVVLAMIYALGDNSGAHLNPAVTLGFLLARRRSCSAWTVGECTCTRSAPVHSGNSFQAQWPQWPLTATSRPGQGWGE